MNVKFPTGDKLVIVRYLLMTVLLTSFQVLGSRAEPPSKVALQGGRIIPVCGPEIPQGTLLIEHGKITAVGETVDIPYDAMVVDVSGQVLFPGMVSPHTAQGLDRQNENLPVTPYLDVYDAIDPSSLFFEDALREGVLTLHVIQGNNCVIGGLSRLVRPIGRTPDEMTRRPTMALKICTSPKSGSDRMQQLAALREAFLELEFYLENLAEKRYEEKLAEDKKELDVGPEEARKRGRELIRDEDIDDRHRNLVQLTDGRLDAWIYCGAATDVGPAIAVAKAHGFLERTVFVLGTEAYRAVQELKGAERPVVLPPDLIHRERDPITGELSETFIPRAIHDAGLLFALQPNADASLAERYLNYQAALCVRHGIPRQAALESITLNPAKILGVADRLGSLEVGKAGDVVVLSGDPLDFNTWIEKAFIDGILAYDRAKDVRLKELLELEQQPAAEKDPKEQPPEKDPKEPAVEKDPKEPAADVREDAREETKEQDPAAAERK